MARDANAFSVTQLHGRNGWNSPLDLPSDVAAEMRNMHVNEGACGQKRAGSTSITITGATGLNALARFVPGQDDTLAELFAVDNSATYKILRMAGGSTFANLTLKDDILALILSALNILSFVGLNGKLFIAYRSAVNRLHVFDAGLSTTTVRRTGMATSAAPTAANTGGGAYPAVLRYYAVAFTEQRAGVTVRRGEVGASVSFTPSGAGTAARVTKPANPGEGETHWELYASTDNILFYLIATTVIGTTTVDDSAVVTTYANNSAAASAGTYTNWPSVKFLATDGNRLLGYGAHETVAGDAMTPKNGRVYFSPVIDTTGTADEERVSNSTTVQGFLDISRNSSSVDRGITPKPINNNFVVFQDKGITLLVPTEAADLPYRRVKISSELGAVSNQSIVMAEDEVGRPCVYFLDPELGPYRFGAGGFQRCGKDVQDIWDTVNTSAVNAAWGLYYKPLNLVIFAVCTSMVSNDPDTMLVFDVTEGRVTDQDGVRNGWFVWDGDFAAQRCGVMFSSTIGASMSRKLVPYVGTTKLLKYDTTKTLDDTTAFRGYFTSRAMVGDLWPTNKSAIRSYLLATANAGVTMQQAWIRNFGDDVNRVDSVTLTPSGSETRLVRKFESPELTDAQTIQVQIGDAAAVSSTWTLERWWADVSEGSLL